MAATAAHWFSRVGKVVAIGRNYVAHAAELSNQVDCWVNVS